MKPLQEMHAHDQVKVEHFLQIFFFYNFKTHQMFITQNNYSL